MDEKKYQLPPRKWYSLEQAVKRIRKLTGEEIEIADLLHYWIIQQIPFATRVIIFDDVVKIGNVVISGKDFNYFNESNLSNNDNNETEEDEEIPDFSLFPEENMDESIIEDISKPICELNNINIKSYHDEYMCFFNHSGLVKDINEKKGISLNDVNFLIYPNIDADDITAFLFSIKQDLWEHNLHLKINKIFILNSDLEKFLNGNVNGNGNGNDKEIELKNKLDAQLYKKDDKKIGTKTLNSQSEFIRNLITIHYGEKVANNIRSELENPRSRITCEFEKNGLKAPSGKAVDRWINKI